ncbi:hypothetical protein HS088_TW01G00260 [Tripterygium wilfordii]|uniref:Uncharacterized protein n=1 Tax=Tripterygium wilfordii TaxID=458696 RepID=A0A7J7E112_TRIWF|nr:hypothetical protein HS088_TW01G00260 [Tripterygium wilfordii]
MRNPHKYCQPHLATQKKIFPIRRKSFGWVLEEGIWVISLLSSIVYCICWESSSKQRKIEENPRDVPFFLSLQFGSDRVPHVKSSMSCFLMIFNHNSLGILGVDLCKWREQVNVTLLSKFWLCMFNTKKN